MSNILQLISENSFEVVHGLLEECQTYIEKTKLSNQKNKCNISTLFLATTSMPPIEAVRLVNALVAAGASPRKLDNEKRNVLLYDCKAGVDPMIFDAILNSKPRKLNHLDEWWVLGDKFY